MRKAKIRYVPAEIHGEGLYPAKPEPVAFKEAHVLDQAAQDAMAQANIGVAAAKRLRRQQRNLDKR